MPEPCLPAPFVIGVDRSGTTLLRLMLDAHSELAIPSETHFLPCLVRRRSGRLSRRRFLALVTTAQTWPNLALDDDAFRTAVRKLQPFAVSDGLRCLYRMYAERFGKTRWGDKTPHYGDHMQSIASLLPEAHFVHLIRDGRDVAQSLRGRWWGPGDDIDAQARLWVNRIERSRRQSHDVPHYYEVRYEELVRDPEATLRGICDYVALAFEPSMLAYHETAASRLSEYKQPFGPPARPTEIAPFISMHERVTHPPDPSRIGRWKIEMAEHEQRRYEKIAGPLLRKLGYETRF